MLHSPVYSIVRDIHRAIWFYHGNVLSRNEHKQFQQFCKTMPIILTRAVSAIRFGSWQDLASDCSGSSRYSLSLDRERHAHQALEHCICAGSRVVLCSTLIMTGHKRAIVTVFISQPFTHIPEAAKRWLRTEGSRYRGNRAVASKRSGRIPHLSA